MTAGSGLGVPAHEVARHPKVALVRSPSRAKVPPYRVTEAGRRGSAGEGLGPSPPERADRPSTDVQSPADAPGRRAHPDERAHQGTWHRGPSMTVYCAPSRLSASAVIRVPGRLRRNARNRAARILPMDLRPQAHDIIRTWTFYTIVKSYFHHGDIPWRDVVISGHVHLQPRGLRRRAAHDRPVAPRPARPRGRRDHTFLGRLRVRDREGRDRGLLLARLL